MFSNRLRHKADYQQMYSAEKLFSSHYNILVVRVTSALNQSVQLCLIQKQLLLETWWENIYRQRYVQMVLLTPLLPSTAFCLYVLLNKVMLTYFKMKCKCILYFTNDATQSNYLIIICCRSCTQAIKSCVSAQLVTSHEFSTTCNSSLNLLIKSHC